MTSGIKLNKYLSEPKYLESDLKEVGYWGEKYNYSVFAPSKKLLTCMMFALLGGLIAAALKLKQFIVIFTEKGLILIEVNIFSNIVQTETMKFIKKAEISSIKIKSGPLRYSINILTNNQNLNLIANKKVIGFPSQAEALKEIANIYK